MNTSRKRSQNHFRLHFTSETPYNFFTRGILSTVTACVHGRLKTTTGKAISTIRKRYWQTIRTRNTIQWNIWKDDTFYSRRHVLRVKCVWNPEPWILETLSRYRVILRHFGGFPREISNEPVSTTIETISLPRLARSIPNLIMCSKQKRAVLWKSYLSCNRFASLRKQFVRVRFWKILFTFYHHSFRYGCSRISSSFGHLFLHPRMGTYSIGVCSAVGTHCQSDHLATRETAYVSYSRAA